MVILVLFYISFGMLLITVGATLLNSISEILAALTELIKANISERIMKHNVAINKLNEGESHTRAIGFAATFEEEDGYE